MQDAEISRVGPLEHTISLETRPQRGFLLLGEPGSLCRPVGEIKIRRDAETHCRQSFDQKQPTPTRQPEKPVELEDGTRQCRGETDRRWNRQREERIGSRAALAWKPVSQVEQDTGPKARLGD